MVRLPDVSKVANACDFTLTPTLSLKGEGELEDLNRRNLSAPITGPGGCLIALRF